MDVNKYFNTNSGKLLTASLKGYIELTEQADEIRRKSNE